MGTETCLCDVYEVSKSRMKLKREGVLVEPKQKICNHSTEIVNALGNDVMNVYVLHR